jgi:hypothetical protein
MLLRLSDHKNTFIRFLRSNIEHNVPSFVVRAEGLLQSRVPKYTAEMLVFLIPH